MRMTPSLYSWQIAHCHAEVVRKFASKWVMALGGGMVAGVAVTCQWQREHGWENGKYVQL